MSMGESPKTTACVYEVTAVMFFFSIGFGFSLSVFLTSLFIYSGVVPQHPPITLTPIFARSQSSSANSSDVTLKTVFPSIIFGIPAFGFKTTGTDEYSRSLMATERSCFGPREQLAPIASAPIPSSISAITSGVAPVMSFPSSPYAFVTITGRLEFSLAASRAALVS